MMSKSQAILALCLAASSACLGVASADSRSAEIALLQGEYARARRVLVPIARQQRKGRHPARHQFNVARVSFAEGNFRSAKRDCAKLKRFAQPDKRNITVEHFERKSANGAFWFHLCNARALLINRRTAPAENEMKAAIEALGNREFGLQHLHIAIATLELGNQQREHKAAVEFANQTLAAAAQSKLSDDSSVPYLLARILIERAKNETSHEGRLRSYQEAVRHVPEHPDALLGLGVTRSDPVMLKKAAKLRSGWLEPLRQLAELSLAQKDFGQAFEAARTILKRARNDRSALRVAALSAAQLKHESAWDRLGRALHVMPNDADLLMVEANLLHQKGEHEQALEKLERVAALQTANPKPYIECAKIAFASSRPRLAGGYLDQALARDPNNSEARRLCQKTTCHAE